MIKFEFLHDDIKFTSEIKHELVIKSIIQEWFLFAILHSFEHKSRVNNLILFGKRNWLTLKII